MTDAAKLTGVEYDNQIRARSWTIYPKPPKNPETKAPSAPLILAGEVNTNYFDRRSNYFSSEFDVYTDSAEIQFPVMDFPDGRSTKTVAPFQSNLIITTTMA